MAKNKEPKYGMALAIENAKFDILAYTKKQVVTCGCKQVIEIPDRVTETFFNLPCVYSVRKDKKKGCIVWNIERDNNTIQFAYPGDLLCQLQTGDWLVYARNQFKKTNTNEHNK